MELGLAVIKARWGRLERGREGSCGCTELMGDDPSQAGVLARLSGGSREKEKERERSGVVGDATEGPTSKHEGTSASIRDRPWPTRHSAINGVMTACMATCG